MDKEIQDKTQINANRIHLNTQASDCGYCHGSKSGGNKTWGLTSGKTRVDDYENLMNRGWRRCGTYYYKTDLKGSCCQLYTIRLRAQDFRLSAKQRKALTKFNRFLNGELDFKLEGKKAAPEAKKDEKKKSSGSPTFDKCEQQIYELVQHAMLEVLMKDEGRLGLAKSIAFADIKPKVKVSRPKHAAYGDLSTNAAIILFNVNKQRTGGKAGAEIKDVAQVIMEKMGKQCEELKFRAESTPNGYINFKAEFNLRELAAKEEGKPGKEVKPKHVPTEEKKPEEKKKSVPEEEKKGAAPQFQYSAYFKGFVPNTNPSPKHVYTVEIVPAIPQIDAFETYKAYQAQIHNQHDETISGFTRFLCNSPLYDPRNEEDVKRPIPISDDSKKISDQGVWPKFFGSYHMRHKIDGKVIAVGVLDFCPTVLSSVYFFYDPKYKFLNMGIVGALREIEYIRRIQEQYSKSFEFYYLGYYIHDCIKSVYKGDYCPSELLCPETFTWVPLEKARPIVAKNGYSRLADPGVEVAADMRFSAEDIARIMNDTIIVTPDSIIPFNDVTKKWKTVLEEMLRKLGKSVLEHLAWTA